MTVESSCLEIAEELKDLRSRLAEAEEVLRAIRSGEVDALLVTGARGEQVYTLTEKKLHEQLVEAERLARLILEQAAEAIIVCDQQGLVISASQVAQRVCSSSPLQRPFAEAFPLRTDASELFRIAPVLQGETLQNVDVALERHGQTLSFLLNAGPLLNGQQVLGCVVTLTDIRERKLAAEELHEKEHLLSEAQRIGHIGSWLIDMTGRMTWSEELYRVFGVLPDTFTPAVESLLGLIHPEDRPSMQAWLAACAAGAKPPELEFRICRPDGTVRFIKGNGEAVLDAGHRLLHMAGTGQDITEKHNLEDKLRQTAKMEAIGQLAGGVAHDFNNMLFVINGRAEIAMNGMKPDDPLRAQLMLIYETGGRAANLTRQLLAFSRQQTLQPKIINLNSIVTDMSKMLFRLIREDITMKLVLYPKLRPTKADPGQVEQVLMNLVVNARDAMAENGTLTIETANVEFDETFCLTHSEAKPGRYVMLAVSDTGCGMDDRVKSRIFEPFFTTKEQGQGTGLGLATVYGIVKQSNGHIVVYSELGKGTTFKVYLPETAPAPARASQLVAAVVPHGTETILLVEDETDVRNLAAEILRSSGYKVLLASDGNEALSICKRRDENISLIISDVVMPKMNGPEMVQQARILHPGIKVLFISGAVSNSSLLPAGTHYLQKPFTSGALARKVREVLDCAGETTANKK